MFKPLISLIIPAYNEAELLPEVLSQVKAAVAQVEDEVELILVDNASTDGTGAIAESFGFKVVFEEKNQIARARNRGAAVAEGDYLLFLDADTWLPEELLEAIVVAIKSGQVCGGGVRIAFKDDVSAAAKRMVGLWNWFSGWSHIAAGSLLFCRRDAFVAVGGFPHHVYAGEEVYLSRKLIRWGKRNQLPFRILKESVPVQTSARKLRWHHPVKIWLIHFSLVIFPFLMRSRRYCRFWYERPEG